MSKDIRMFNLCSHIIHGEYSEPDKCIRCYGRGWYFDIGFDENGHTITSEGTLKLQQELLKITLEEKGENPFYEFWGNEANKRLIGSKNHPQMKSKIELLVRDCIEYLKSVQIGNQKVYQNMSNEEILSSIDKIEVEQASLVGYSVRVLVTSQSGDNIDFGFEIKI